MKTATKQAQRTPDWKATLRANVRKLNAAQAQAWLDRYNAENPDKGGTIAGPPSRPVSVSVRSPVKTRTWLARGYC